MSESVAKEVPCPVARAAARTFSASCTARRRPASSSSIGLSICWLQRPAAASKISRSTAPLCASARARSGLRPAACSSRAYTASVGLIGHPPIPPIDEIFCAYNSHRKRALFSTPQLSCEILEFRTKLDPIGRKRALPARPPARSPAYAEAIRPGSSRVRWAMKPERLSPAAAANASRRFSTRRGRVIFTRSVVSSSKAGSTVMTPNIHPA